ncbi:MAG: Wzz/FepE/Etk N-terminal domain-containing protein, partial [bacterium]
MEIKEIFDMLRRRWKILLISTAICSVIFLSYLLNSKPLFTATSKVLVRTTDNSWGGYDRLPHLAEIAALEGVRNVQTQTELLKSNTVFSKTIKELGAKGSDIVSRKINPLGDSDVISVTVIATAADMAVKAANKLPEVYLGL